MTTKKTITSSQEEMLAICSSLKQLLAVMEGYLHKTTEVREEITDDEMINHDCPLCKKKAEGEIPPDEAKETPALNELGKDNEAADADKDGDAAADDHEDCECGGSCDDCKQKVANSPNIEKQIKDYQAECKILTLTTSHKIKATHIAEQKNTTLSVAKLQVDEDRIRFKFNTFEHVLPRQLESHKATVVNEAHEFSTQTVRLVLDFNGKTYPALVDLVEGEEDVLTIGDDLFETLRKDGDDVSSK